MADFGLFVGFGQPVRGRERQAIQVFDETARFFAGLQERGEIEGFEAVFLEPHGGDLGGFFLVRGDRDAVARLRTSDDFQRVTFRAGLVVEGLGVVAAAVGARIGESMAAYQEAVGDLV